MSQRYIFRTAVKLDAISQINPSKIAAIRGARIGRRGRILRAADLIVFSLICGLIAGIFPYRRIVPLYSVRRICHIRLVCRLCRFPGIRCLVSHISGWHIRCRGVIRCRTICIGGILRHIILRSLVFIFGIIRCCRTAIACIFCRNCRHILTAFSGGCVLRIGLRRTTHRLLIFLFFRQHLFPDIFSNNRGGRF